jgi:erythritol/L-threitol dehydrogenase
MRAAVLHGPGDVRLTEVADPMAGDGAVVAVEAAGVCAADRMLWRGDSPWTLRYPFTPGHELLGRVVAIAPAASERWGVAGGDRVTAEVMVPCGRCGLCARGRLCRAGRHLGSDVPGAFADLVALPPDAVVHRVPDALPVEAAVLAEPAACALHAVRRADIGPGDLVAVSGVGAIGAAAIALASARGARVVAVLRGPGREALARACGAADVVVGEVAGAFGGPDEGPDVWIECSGAPAAVQHGLDALVPGGRMVLYGVYGERARVDWNQLAEFAELDVRGAHLAPGAFPEAIAALADGTIPGAIITTHRVPLDEVGRALSDDLAGSRTKVMIAPGNP